MTSEHKLAMIVGFSLVLAVGILISDHLSRARLAELADLGEEAASITPVLVETPASRPERLRPARRDALSIDIMNPQSREPARHETEPLLGVPLASVTRNDPAPEEAIAIEDSPAGPVAGVTEQATIASQISIPTIGFLRTVSESSDAPEIENTSGETPRGHRVYHVRAGDSLYSIAQRELGDGNRWREIAELNADRVGKDGSVRVRVALKIPGGDESFEPALSHEQPAYGEYVVQKGDTLGEISQKLLGTVRRTDELLEHNQSSVKNANSIRPGMVLRYPLGPEA